MMKELLQLFWIQLYFLVLSFAEAIRKKGWDIKLGVKVYSLAKRQPFK